MKRGEVYTVNLDPTQGAEMKKTRPCVVVSPDEMNNHMQVVIVAPITSVVRYIPTRVAISASKKNGLITDSYVVLDQIKTVDKSRLAARIGTLTQDEIQEVSNVLCEMFSY